MLSALSSAQDLQHVIDVFPGFIVSDSDGNKQGTLTIKTAWKPEGAGENSNVELGLFIRAVGEPDIDTFHKGYFWQIATSKDDETEQAEIYYFQLTRDSIVYDQMTYGVANLNVASLNDKDGENPIWKLAVNEKFASYSYVLKADGAPVEYPGQTAIPANFWQVGNNLSRRSDPSRTWQLYLHRPANSPGVADIKVGGTVKSNVWYLKPTQ